MAFDKNRSEILKGLIPFVLGGIAILCLGCTSSIEKTESSIQLTAIPTKQITPTLTQEEQGISEEEKERILSEYDNTLTYGEMETLMGADNLQAALNAQRPAGREFLYYFEDGKYFGTYYGDYPYSGLYGTLKQWMPNLIENSVEDETLFDMMIDSHNRQFLDRTKPPEEALLWEEGDKITMVFYVYKDSDEFGEFTVPWSDGGGIYIIKPTNIYESNPPYEVIFVPLPDIKNRVWTDEELKELEKGYMILDYRLEEGEVIGRGNYKEMMTKYNLR